jgi:hypothetical protein
MSSPKQWGPHMWKLIHVVCKIKYNDISINKAILRKISDCLPISCYCRDLYDQSLSLIEIINTNKELYEWSVQLHNQVNTKLKKEQYISPADESDFIELPMSDRTWEIYVWDYLHTIAQRNMDPIIPEDMIIYDNTQYLDKMVSTLESIEGILSDNAFRMFYRKKLEDLKMIDKSTLVQRRFFYDWTIRIHNERNQIIGDSLVSDTYLLLHTNLNPSQLI